MLRREYTVGDAIKAALPEGSNPTDVQASVAKFYGARRKKEIDPWRTAPLIPTDMFAAVGHLCHMSGLIGFFEPSPYRKDTERCEFVLNKEHRRAADKAGKEWRESSHGLPPNHVQDLWDELLSSWDENAGSESYVERKKGPPEWWRTALLLVMISDMACNRLLRDPLSKFAESAFEDWIKTVYRITLDREHAVGSGQTHDTPPPSLGIMADSNIVCVLPKIRVSPVGATMRNVSRNLSLLPGKGRVRCFWETPIGIAPPESRESLDILLIPEPSNIPSRSFSESGPGEEEDSDRNLHYWARDWNTFELGQSWIEGKAQEKFLNDCEELMGKAQEESRSVNGVILPEYAVNRETFDLLCERLKRKEKALDFVIAGSSESHEGDRGNHVMTRVWYKGDDVQLTHSRCKHHRWRMDRSQVETYGLSSSLNPKIRNWWEDTPLGQRQIQFQRFREKSVFSVLICEELARSEPCHEILRSVAPNLIFALLLDGPQIRTRWPAQYAANLADDPGSSVLTFTSYGLIDRSNRQGRYDPNHSIALWKDDTGKVVEMQMPMGKGMRGILLSLWSEHVLDRTMTGKQSQVLAWRYANHMPVSLD